MQPGTSAQPERIGISPKKLEGAYSVLQQAAQDGRMMGCAVRISREGEALETRAFGKMRLNEDVPVKPDTIFLCASVTKPVTSTAAMILVEKGKISLDDPVCTIIPEFGDGGKRDRILVRHLLTHTSGLPDQLPENRELRSHHATLSEFIQKTYRTPLLFDAGTDFSYQSSGMAMLMDIVQRVTGLSLAEFLRREVFGPVGMQDTSMGVDWNKSDRVSQINIPKETFQYGEADASDWNWNSKYWWSLGSPWGGMASTASDLTKLLLAFLNQGRAGSEQILSPATVRAMTTNQVETFRLIPEDARRNNPWGFGWQLKSPFRSRFGELVSPATFGHWGATGTLVWADPVNSLTCVALTNQPYEGIAPILGKFSNAVAGSLMSAT
jgi:CubicO group peptidase (beta-lactamase class C family)